MITLKIKEAISKLVSTRAHLLRFGAFVLLLAMAILLAGAPFDVGEVKLLGVAALYVLLLPGFLFGEILLPQSFSGGARLLLSISSAFAGALILTYAFQALPGAPTKEGFLLVLSVLSIVGFVLQWRRHRERLTFSVSSGLLLVALIVGAFFRFAHLGSAEFQGDETRAMHLASAVLVGQDDVLFLHRKGPGEVLFPAATLILAGTINEWSARLPFALCGLLILPALYILASSLWPTRSRAIGGMAALLVSVDGFLLAFSRIVQYQTPLVFFLLCSAIVLWQLHSVSSGERRLLYFGALFFSAALLCHYDAMLVLPALAVMLIVAWKRSSQQGRFLSSIVQASAAGLVLVGLFYLPFFLNRHFSDTSQYLSARIGPQGLPYNNVGSYLSLLSFYSASYLVAFVVVVLLSACAWMVCCRFGGGWRASAISALLLVLVLSAVLTPAAFMLGNGSSWAVAVFAVPCALLLIAGTCSVEIKVLTLWAAVPFFFFSFISYRPNTHFYVLHAAAALLCAYTIQQVGSAKLFGRLSLVPSWLLGSVVVLSLPYLYVVFVRLQPEYRFVYPRARIAGYWAPYGNRLPKGGYFGFPHRSGWKVISELYRRGDLQGSYSSNEEELITTWYLSEAPRNDASPDNYFLVRAPNDTFKVNRLKIEAEYIFAGRVYIDNERCLDIYKRPPALAPGTPRRYYLADFVGTFDSRRRMGRLYQASTLR